MIHGLLPAVDRRLLAHSATSQVSRPYERIPDGFLIFFLVSPFELFCNFEVVFLGRISILRSVLYYSFY